MVRKEEEEKAVEEKGEKEEDQKVGPEIWVQVAEDFAEMASSKEARKQQEEEEEGKEKEDLAIGAIE